MCVLYLMFFHEILLKKNLERTGLLLQCKPPFIIKVAPHILSGYLLPIQKYTVNKIIRNTSVVCTGWCLLLFVLSRGSSPEVFIGKGVPKISGKSTGGHPFLSAISIKLQSSFIEFAVRHGCSPVNLLHILTTPFLKNTSGWLVLNIGTYINISTRKYGLDCVSFTIDS